MAEAASDSDPFLGRHLADKYVIESLIGGGSMGAVYRARQIALHRVVAIKVMYPELASDREFAARFRREAHAASRLAHVNSITITDFGEEPDGLLYLVMEYVNGPSLEDLVERREPLPEERIVDILSQILSACAAAHDAGIVHRDLKPANVLVLEKFDDDGFPMDHVKVCDFGVASLKDAAEGGVVRPSQDGLAAVSMQQALDAKKQPPRPKTVQKALTMAGAVVGTPAYMSPEQATGKPQDARSDLYSLGVVLYELITRDLPYDGRTVEELMHRHVAAPVPNPADRVACSPKLAEVCMRAMAKKPEDRYLNARAMRADLRSVFAAISMEGLPTAYPASGPVPRSTMRASVHVPRLGTLPGSLGVNTPDPMPVSRAPLPSTPEAISAPEPGAKKKPAWIVPAGVALLVAAGLGGFFALRTKPDSLAGVAPSAVSTTPVTDPTPVPTVAPAPSALVAMPAPPASAVTSDPTLPKTTASRTATGPSKPAASAEPAAVAPAVPPPVVPSAAPTPPPATPAVTPPPATPTTPAVTPAPAAPAAAFAPDHGRVRIALVSTSRIAKTAVSSLVARLNFDVCYRTTLRAVGHAEGGAGSVSLDIDEDGIVSNATAKLPGPLAGASGCITAKIRGQRLASPPDTGSAGAVLSLAFEP